MYFFYLQFHLCFNVTVYVQILYWTASCNCAATGNRTNLTVCACRSTGSLVFYVMALTCISYLAVGIVLMSIVRDSWISVVNTFFMSKLLSLLYELPLSTLWFAWLRWRQRNDKRFNSMAIVLDSKSALMEPLIAGSSEAVTDNITPNS